MEELQEILIPMEDEQEEYQSEQEFVEDVYNLAVKYNHRENGVYPSDFLFHTIPTVSEYYWMANDHPVAKMLKENGYKERGTFSGQLGSIVVYDKISVNICIDSIVQLCQKYKLKINDH